MPDLAVTVPQLFGLDAWICEGQLPGEPPDEEEYAFTIGWRKPCIEPGERVYVTYNGKLRGYAPLVCLDEWDRRYAIVRAGGAVAVTIPERIPGFRGFRYRWWPRKDEVPFPDWMTP